MFQSPYPLMFFSLQRLEILNGCRVDPAGSHTELRSRQQHVLSRCGRILQRRDRLLHIGKYEDDRIGAIIWRLFLFQHMLRIFQEGLHVLLPLQDDKAKRLCISAGRCQHSAADDLFQFFLFHFAGAELTGAVTLFHTFDHIHRSPSSLMIRRSL